MDEIDEGYIKLAQAVISDAFFTLDWEFFKYNAKDADAFLALAFHDSGDAGWATSERFQKLVEGLRDNDPEARAIVSRISFIDTKVLVKFKLREGNYTGSGRKEPSEVIKTLKYWSGRKTAEQLSVMVGLSPRWVRSLCQKYGFEYKRVTRNTYR